MLKLLKKIGLIVLLVAVVITVSLWQPWKYITNLSLIGTNSALTVNSTGGKAEVYLDDEKIGETPFSTENLSPGDYSLEVKRVTEKDDFYTTITKQVHIESNTRTLLEVEIGPSLQFSSYSLIYFRQNESDETSLYIDTAIENATVTIDGDSYTTSPVILEDVSPKEYNLKVSATGYEDQEISIIARKGYTLIADIDLMIKPIKVQ